MPFDELSFNYIPKNPHGLLNEMYKIVKTDKVFSKILEDNLTQYKNPEFYSRYNDIFSIETDSSFSIVEFDLRRALVNVLKHFYPDFYKKIERKGCINNMNEKDKREVYKCVNLTLESILGSKENLSLFLSDVERIFKILLFSHVLSVGKPYRLIKFVRDGALVIMEDFNPYEKSVASLYFVEVKSFVLRRYIYFGRRGEIYFYPDERAEFKGMLKNLSDFLKSIVQQKIPYGYLLDRISQIENEIKKYYDVLSNEEIFELVKDVYISDDGKRVYVSSKKFYVPLEKYGTNGLKNLFNPKMYDFYSIYNDVIYPIIRTLI